jgi:hypothetical protein
MWEDWAVKYMKISEMLAVIDKVAASCPDLASAEASAVLTEFSEAMKAWNEKSLGAFVKLVDAAMQRYANR